jgi:hypothetical protein
MIQILQKLAVVWTKTAIFWRKYFYNHDIGPKITRLGEFSLVVYFWANLCSLKFITLVLSFFFTESFVLNMTKGLTYILGEFSLKTAGHPGSNSTFCQTERFGQKSWIIFIRKRKAGVAYQHIYCSNDPIHLIHNKHANKKPGGWCYKLNFTNVWRKTWRFSRNYFLMIKKIADVRVKFANFVSAKISHRF